MDYQVEESDTETIEEAEYMMESMARFKMAKVRSEKTLEEAGKTAKMMSILAAMLATVNDYLEFNQRNGDSPFDFTIKTCNSRKIEAHKLKLAAVSEVFRRMFTHDCVETKTNEVTIGDFEDVTVDNFVRFMYHEKLAASASYTPQLLYMAHRYGYQALMDACVKAMAANLSEKNVAEVWEAAEKLELAGLLESVQEFLQGKWDSLKSDPGVQDFIVRNPLAMVGLCNKFKATEAALQKKLAAAKATEAALQSDLANAEGYEAYLKKDIKASLEGRFKEQSDQLQRMERRLGSNNHPSLYPPENLGRELTDAINKHNTKLQGELREELEELSRKVPAVYKVDSNSHALKRIESLLNNLVTEQKKASLTNGK